MRASFTCGRVNLVPFGGAAGTGIYPASFQPYFEPTIPHAITGVIESSLR